MTSPGAIWEGDMIIFIDTVEQPRHPPPSEVRLCFAEGFLISPFHQMASEGFLAVLSVHKIAAWIYLIRLAGLARSPRHPVQSKYNLKERRWESGRGEV